MYVYTAQRRFTSTFGINLYGVFTNKQIVMNKSILQNYGYLPVTQVIMELPLRKNEIMLGWHSKMNPLRKKQKDFRKNETVLD